MTSAADASPAKRARAQDSPADPASGVAALRATFDKCRSEGRPAFIPYVTAGFPALDSTVPILLALQAGGADVIELGMPFSDPLADGPTIQKSSFDALANGVKLRHCFEYVAEARSKGLTVPVVLMGYYNPFASFGEAKLAEHCAKAGISGFIVVDLPPDDATAFSDGCEKHGLCLIPLVAPTSTDERLAVLAKLAKGYVYLVSLTGVTGSRTELPKDLPELIAKAKKHFDIPLAVGFGLSSPEHVRAVFDAGAEGAVVGSAVINELRKNPKDDVAGHVKAIEEYVKRITARPGAGSASASASSA